MPGTLRCLVRIVLSAVNIAADSGLVERGDVGSDYCTGLQCLAICTGQGIMDNKVFHYSVVADLPRMMWKNRAQGSPKPKVICYSVKDQPYPASCRGYLSTEPTLDPNEWAQYDAFRALPIREVNIQTDDDAQNIKRDIIYVCCAPIWEDTYFLNYKHRGMKVTAPSVRLACGPGVAKVSGSALTCSRVFPGYAEGEPCGYTSRCLPTFEAVGKSGCAFRAKTIPPEIIVRTRDES